MGPARDDVVPRSRGDRLAVIAIMSLVIHGAAWGQRPTLAITDVTLIDGTGAAARLHVTVVIGGVPIVLRLLDHRVLPSTKSTLSLRNRLRDGAQERGP